MKPIMSNIVLRPCSTPRIIQTDQTQPILHYRFIVFVWFSNPHNLHLVVFAGESKVELFGAELLFDYYVGVEFEG